MTRNLRRKVKTLENKRNDPKKIEVVLVRPGETPPEPREGLIT